MIGSWIYICGQVAVWKMGVIGFALINLRKNGGESFPIKRPGSATLWHYLPGLPSVLLCGESEFNEVG